MWCCDALAKEICIKCDDEVAGSATSCLAQSNIGQGILQLRLRHARLDHQDTELREVPTCMIHPFVIRVQVRGENLGGCDGTHLLGLDTWLRLLCIFCIIGRYLVRD